MLPGVLLPDAKREARELQTTLTLTQEKLTRVEQRMADVQERYMHPLRET